MAEDRRYEGFSLLAGFVIGSLTLGLLAFLLAKTFAALRGAASNQLGSGGQPINIYNVSGDGRMLPMPVTEWGTRERTEAMALPDVSLASKMETYTLSPSRSARVFTAPRKGPMWRVRIQLIGPAGGFGVFAIDAPISETSPIGSPQGIVVPSNGYSEIRLGPRQILYGRAAGTEEDVQVSITASAEIV